MPIDDQSGDSPSKFWLLRPKDISVGILEHLSFAFASADNLLFSDDEKHFMLNDTE